MTDNLTAIVTICNKKGLHARAAAKFVKVASAHDATILVAKICKNATVGGEEVSGCSILGLMMLGAEPGSRLVLKTGGAQGEQLLAALVSLVEQKFGESE